MVGSALFPAPQSVRIGHFSQLGSTGLHTVAPSSISAWLNSPAPPTGINSSAVCQSLFILAVDFGSPSILKTLVNTRMTFVSRTGADWLNAIDLIAPLV